MGLHGNARDFLGFEGLGSSPLPHRPKEQVLVAITVASNELHVLYRRFSVRLHDQFHDHFRTHAVLHSAFKQAMRWDLILRNPADLVRPPTVPRQEMKALTGAEVSKLLEAATDPTLCTLYVVAATAGLRRGELLGLRWTDIDFERAIITVQRTAQRIRGEGIVYGEPKTNAGRRSVRIGALAIQHLRNQRTHQLEQRLRAGPAWIDLGLVFNSAVGTAIEEARVTRTFQQDLERAELPRVRLHDLRHTAATLLISQGVSMKAVQATLGHSTIATTMDVYAHVTPSMQDSVSEAMDRLFPANG